jgi:hypothetical protein
MVKKRLEAGGWRLVERLPNLSSQRRRKFFTLLFVLSLFFLFPFPATALEAPLALEAFDMPSDGGDSIGLRWRAIAADSPATSYRIFVSEQENGEFKQIAEFPASSHYETEVAGPWWVWGAKHQDLHFFQVKSNSAVRLTDGKPYFFKVARIEGQTSAESSPISAVPRANLFNWAKLNNLLIMLAFSATVLVSIRRARVNPNIFLRRIPGLDAVEEAVGRATEMGRPILYLTGIDDMSSLSTIAATVILGEVAKRVATYGTDLIVPHRDPIVMAVCQEIVRESYLAVGRPDAYKEDSNFFITSDQFSYTAAVDGIMLREKPAANFFMGAYFAESLLLAEPGAATGAIQIAGTDSDHQLPFFITACDYTLIGEELYAASAYLSREPVLVGTLRGQDLGKGFFLAVMVIGTLLVTLGALLGTPVFRTFFQLFGDFK